MTFQELEKICSLLWGQSWQSELARELKIDRRTVNHWKRQGVAKWVKFSLLRIVESRVEQVINASEMYKSYSLVGKGDNL